MMWQLPCLVRCTLRYAFHVAFSRRQRICCQQRTIALSQCFHFPQPQTGPAPQRTQLSFAPQDDTNDRQKGEISLHFLPRLLYFGRELVTVVDTPLIPLRHPTLRRRGPQTSKVLRRPIVHDQRTPRRRPKESEVFDVLSRYLKTSTTRFGSAAATPNVPLAQAATIRHPLCSALLWRTHAVHSTLQLECTF